MDEERKYRLQGSQSIERALKLLMLFRDEDSGKTLTELSQALGLNKSTTLRILNTLDYYDFITHDPLTKQYRLGIALFELGFTVGSQMSLRKLGSPLISQIATRLNETVHLSVLDNFSVLCIDKAEGTQTIRMNSHIGERGYVHCSGSGKLLAAYMGDDWVDQLIQTVGLPKFTENTITDKNKFKDNLRVIRSNDYSIDIRESEEEISCIAVPVRDKSQKVIAVISVAGPSTRIKVETIKDILPELKKAADYLSRQMGYNTNLQAEFKLKPDYPC